MSMVTLHITVDKADSFAEAEQRAYEIADQFFANGGLERDYHLEQVDAYPEQQVLTAMNGQVVAKTPVTFYVEFVARCLS